MRECIELVAERNYVLTTYLEGDKNFSFSRGYRVKPEMVENYHTMPEFEAHILQIRNREERIRREEEMQNRINKIKK